MMNDNYDEKGFSLYKQRCESENPYLDEYLDEEILRVAYDNDHLLPTISFFSLVANIIVNNIDL